MVAMPNAIKNTGEPANAANIWAEKIKSILNEFEDPVLEEGRPKSLSQHGFVMENYGSPRSNLVAWLTLGLFSKR